MKGSFRTRLLATFALGMLFLGLGLGGTAFFLVKTGLEASLEARGKAQTLYLARQLEEDLLVNDLYAVFRQLESLVAEGVLGFVLGPKGEVMVHTFPGGFPLNLKTLKGRFRFQGEIYRLYRSPIGDGSVGALALAFPETPLWQKLAHLLVLGAWLALGVAALAFLLVSRAANQFLKPLEALVQGVRAWQEGREAVLPDPGGELRVLHQALVAYREGVKRREQELSTLNQVAEAVNRAETPEEVLHNALEALAQSGLFRCGEAWLGEVRVGKVLCPYQEEKDCLLRKGVQGLYHTLELPGARLYLNAEAPEAFREAIKAPIEAGLHRARYTQALKERDQERSQLLKALIQAQEAERARIARDLHDQIGQVLTGIDLGLRAVKEGRLEAVPTLQELVRSAIQDVRHLSRSLRPSALDTLGLEAALKRMAEEFQERTGIRVNLLCRLKGRLPETHETTLYRVVQEALTNVARHAKAKQVSVVLQQEGDGIHLVVEDDGQGFPPQVQPGLGILGMRERIELLGGRFQMESLQGLGTTVYARIPLKEVKA
ncbi:sensor histidine kinase [Thermus caliditerrae]|uniref:Sensor histidine kinase n=1 Tax=Thermus tengchongensis TaxID=1214928 RepID=A0A7V4E5D6_9DEIN|nr:sensor histidine kinase [Thermus caliditerrae]